MLTFEPHGLHWLERSPEAGDLCAHGGVVIRMGDELLADHREQAWTLSAAALFLLRTLESDHTKQAPVGDQLFPCCGHAMYACPDGESVVIPGCPSGLDFEVRHRDRVVDLSIEAREVELTEEAWRGAVVAFSDEIEAFYGSAANKRFFDREAELGYTAFRREWASRRERAGSRLASRHRSPDS